MVFEDRFQCSRRVMPGSVAPTPSLHVIRLAACVTLALIAPRPSSAADGDVFDQFFRYVDPRQHPAAAGSLGEHIDPFTGTLSIVQTDLVLPGKAGLDLRIERSYSSKLWNRIDFPGSYPLAEAEHSVLGYGWRLHLGALVNPNATAQPTSACTADYPIFEAPDGSNRVLYPVDNSNSVFRSQDYWLFQKSCPEAGQGVACLWSPAGIRYEFSPGSSGQNQFFRGMTPVLPVTRIVDPFDNAITITYLAQTGAIDTVIDTYGRSIAFDYSTDDDGLRLTSITANGVSVTYTYTATSGSGGAGQLKLPGTRRFLSAVQPPAGPAWHFEYLSAATVAKNQYALGKVVTPAGGEISFSYDAVQFFTGRDKLPFTAISTKTQAGNQLSGVWEYSYASPGYGEKTTDPAGGTTDKSVTRIKRPDGLYDTYTMYGFGWIADQNRTGYTFLAGRPYEIAHGDRAQVEHYYWTPRNDHLLSTYGIYSAPAYEDNCGPYYVTDYGVASPALDVRVIERDSGTYVTTFAAYDEYARPLSVQESGYLAMITVDGKAPLTAQRTTTWRYLDGLHDTDGGTLNLVQGHPVDQVTCISGPNLSSSGKCVENTWTYDPSFHLLLLEQTESGVRTAYTYHRTSNEGAGNLESVTNALGQRLGLSGYISGGGYGRPTRLDFNGVSSEQRTTSWEGRILSAMDGNSHTTTYGYDDAGRLTDIKPPSVAASTHYDYDPDGTWIRETAGNYVQTRSLDGMGAVVRISDSLGVSSHTVRDPLGRVTFQSYPFRTGDGETGAHYDLDGLGRTSVLSKGFVLSTGACADSNACRETFSFLGGCQAHQVDRNYGDSPATQSCYVAFGDPDEHWLAQTNAADGGLWQFIREGHGLLAEVGAPLPQGIRHFTYDDLGHLSDSKSGEDGHVVFTENAVGQLVQKDTADGSVSYERDDLGRISLEKYSARPEENVTWGYDLADNVTSASSAVGGAFSLGYDAVDRLVRKTWTFLGHTYETDFSYDVPGCRTAVQYPTGSTLTATCDAKNRIVTLSLDGTPVLTSVAYHPSGQPSSFTYGNGRSTQRIYDGRARATDNYAVGVIRDSYAYDGADNLVYLCRDLDGKACSAQDPHYIRRMTYDPADRLLVAVAAGQWGTASFSYDLLGNLTSKLDGGEDFATYTYDSNNRLSAVNASWSKWVPSLTFGWTDSGRLSTSSDGAQYRYDPWGRRASKSTHGDIVVYHYDGQGRLLSETQPDGTRIRDYIYLGDALVASYGCAPGSASTCNQFVWYHTDALGSVLARTDNTGKVVGAEDLSPWGTSFATTGTLDDRQYNGRIYDPGTGLHDYGARMYWPQIGRFVSPDTAGPDLADPRTFNRYSYVLNNPYRYVDPTGRDAVDVLEGIGRGVVEGLTIPTAPMEYGNQDYANGRAFGMKMGGALDIAFGGAIAGGGVITAAGEAVLVPAGAAVAAKGAVSYMSADSVRPGKSFTKKGKEAVKAENAEANGGQATCEKCGEPTVPAKQSKKGVTPPGNETHVDHIIPKSKGGSGTPDNGQVLCRDCNLDKGAN